MSQPRPIERALVCARCAKEKPRGVSHQQYARIQVGLTDGGIQIWCVRHDMNIAHFTPAELATVLAHPPDCDCCRALRQMS